MRRGFGVGNPKASWQQVTEMDTAGVFLVEAHTQTHPRLTTITIDPVRKEVTGARQDIATNVGGKVSDHFAYPYGSYNSAVIAELQAAGYKTGMTTTKGLNTRSTPLFELRRWHGDGRDLPTFLTESGLGTLPPPPPGPGWILDDADPAALPSGAGWTAMSGSSTYQGQSLVGTGGPASTVRWAAYLPEADTMQVHARWSATADRSATAAYTITAADGSHVVTVDQRSRGGEWVSLGSYSFAPDQPAIVTLGGTSGSLSADAIWFSPIATTSSPRDLVIDVPTGSRTQGQAGRGWIGTEWSSLTKSGTGSLVLDRPNDLLGPVKIDAGSLIVTDTSAVASAAAILVTAASTLDLAALPAAYVVPTGQVVSGNGTIGGNVVFGRGSTLSPGSATMPAAATIAVPEPSGVALVALALTTVARLTVRRRRT